MNLNSPAWQKNPAQSASTSKTSGIPGSDSPARGYTDPVTGTTFPQGPYQESWYLSLRDPLTLRALDLRFSILISSNGFRRVAEAWGVFFQKNPGSEAQKIALKESFDLKTFSTVMNKEGFQIADCEFSDTTTRGKVQSKGRSIEWELTMEPRQSTEFDLVPGAVKRMGLVRHMIVTPQPDLAFTGVVRVNGEEYQFNRAPGMQGHQSGPRNAHSWIHGHCNVFTNEQGVPVPFVFEGLSMRSHLLGGIPSPKISSLYFLYQGQQHHFNNIRDAIRLQSRHSLNDWTFQAERGDLLFRGRASVEHKDFAGLSLEDTNGSLIYCATSKFSDLEIHVYNRGKLESALRANQTASMEIASRKKNPYVPILV
ncbi:MAG: hypothetical protein ACJ763_13655 [Bdellovibrionia bacterium]